MTTKSYSHDIIVLAEEIAKRERILESILKFDLQGGKFRMSIAVDHADNQIREDVETVSREHFPADVFMATLLKWAAVDLEKAKISLRVRTSLEKDESEAVL